MTRAATLAPRTAAPPLALGPILCPCDFSSATPPALAAASVLARRFGAELVALHVIPSRVPATAGFHALPNPVLLRPHLRDDVARALAGALAPSRASAVATREELREGRPAAGILETAVQIAAGLIVIGTHGRGAIDRAVLGSVAETVLRKATCPVLAVPPAFAASPEWPRSILWATDFSRDAVASLQYAAGLAAASRAQLVAACVLPGGAASEETARAEARLLATLAERGATNVSARVVTGRPSASILDLARRHGADLVVLGASGAGALGRIVFGSTVLGVVREAECPVLVVRRR